MQLSVRALDPAVRELMLRRVHELTMAQAQSFGVRADLEWRQGYPVLVNRSEPTRFAYRSALARFGAERCVAQTPAVTASEDFAFMLERVPGAYFFIGNGDSPGSCVVHHPGYDFNDENLVVGAATWVGLAEDFLVPQESGVPDTSTDEAARSVDRPRVDRPRHRA